jgi:hypothetical protein
LELNSLLKQYLKSLIVQPNLISPTLQLQMSSPGSASSSRRRSSESDPVSPLAKPFRPPELKLSDVPEDSPISPRSGTDTKRRLRTARTTQRSLLDAQNTQEILGIEQETSQIEEKITSIDGDVHSLTSTNEKLNAELVALREELVTVHKKDVTMEDEQTKKLQRALNSRQRDINVMELNIQKLDREAEKYRRYTNVLAQVIQTMMKENDGLRTQYDEEKADITPESLQFAAELIFKKMFDKLGGLTLKYVFKIYCI